MNANYSVIHNARIAEPAVPAQPRVVEEGQALTLLTGRHFHVLGDLALSALPHVAPHTGGAFLTGVHAPRRFQSLRAAHPTLPLIVEPTSIHKHFATAETPFRIDMADDELFEPSLDAALDLQRLSGSDLAVTPTGQITAGDAASIKAVLRQANALDRTDVLVAMPLDANWLSDSLNLTQLIRVLDRSRHPVLLMLISKSNPLESEKRLRAYTRIFDETAGAVIAYRADVSGLDAWARGAVACAIGAIPSTRRLNPVGEHGFSMDPEDLSPHLLVGDMLRFVRSKHMRRFWFAGAEPFKCFCSVCGGAEIDRLFGSPEDRVVGHLHNVIELGRLTAGVVEQAPEARRALWRDQVAGALDTYPQLSTHIGARLEVPSDLDVWSAAA